MPYKNKEQQREAQRKHYEANKSDYVRRAKIKTAETRVEILALVNDHLKANPCVDCGETDPIVLEFDHKDGTDKEFNISESLSGSKVSPRKVIDEMTKCDVRCANCHRRRTAKQFGWSNKLT